MQEIVQDAPIMPESDPTETYYRLVQYCSRTSKCAILHVEAHFFGISLPRLRNIIDETNLMMHKLAVDTRIDLKLAAAISQDREN